MDTLGTQLHSINQVQIPQQSDIVVPQKLNPELVEMLNARIGDEIHLVDIDCRFLANSQVVGTPNSYCRLIIFQWHEYLDTLAQTGSNLAITLPITSLLNVGAGTVIGVTSPYDIDRQRAKSFTILYDKTFNLSWNVGATSNSSINNKQIHFKKKMRNRVYFANESPTIAKNHVFVLAMSNDTYSATNNPLIYMGHQTRFSDA